MKANLNAATTHRDSNHPEHNRTALDWAVSNNHPGIAALLLDAGAKANHVRI